MALIDVSHLTFGYDGSFEDVFEDVSFQIDTSWRLGFTGPQRARQDDIFKAADGGLSLRRHDNRARAV